MEQLLLQLSVGIIVSAAASLLGVFAVLKKMSLVGDALSHIALPGIALAIFFQINPFVGAVGFLFFAVIGIWLVERYTTLTTETIVGVFFTSALAIGALFIPEFELLEALFGDIEKITVSEVGVTVALSAALIAVLLLLRRQLALNMVSSELASSIGISSRRLDFIYLLLFALGVALGIKFIGALLMGALIIIPAAAAKNIARSLNEFMFLSVAFGVVSAIGGVYISSAYGYPAGPLFILVGAALFVLSFGYRLLLRR